MANMTYDGDVTNLASTVTYINGLLSDFLDAEYQHARQVDPAYEKLIATIKEYVLAGGKRLRPYLCMVSYMGYGGEKAADAAVMATAWELLHTAMLVHDDIIDRDTIRHGQLNITGKYQQEYAKQSNKHAEHYANSSALLAGDLLISASHKIILQSQLPAEQKVKLLQYLNDVIFDVCGGELMDTETALFAINQTDARKIAQYKTASYSFEYPMISGAYLAGASEQELAKIKVLGSKLGLAFQMIDDLLGVFGDKQATGKTTDGDIRERKHTVLVQQAYAKLSGADREELVALYDVSSDLSDSDIARVRQLLVDSGAREYITNEARKLTTESELLIDELAMSSAAKDILHALVAKLLKRDY